MKDFKFFKGTLDMMDCETYATASFNADTPESYMNRRMLYHTNRDEYDRLNNPTNNNEMERYYYDHGLGRFETVRPTLNQEEVTRRINGGGTNNQIRLFQTTTVTTVNPKWWMKVKMFYQKFKYNSVIETNSEVLIIFLITTSITIGVGFIIAKILSIW